MILERPLLHPLVARLQEPRRFLQVVAGPRQVGKTTLVRQTLALLQASPTGAGMAQHGVSADGPGLQGRAWLGAQWVVARSLASQAGTCLLVLDEIQKVADWTEKVKRLWDEDTATPRHLGSPGQKRTKPWQ